MIKLPKQERNYTYKQFKEKVLKKYKEIHKNNSDQEYVGLFCLSDDFEDIVKDSYNRYLEAGLVRIDDGIETTLFYTFNDDKKDFEASINQAVACLCMFY